MSKNKKILIGIILGLLILAFSIVPATCASQTEKTDLAK